MSPRAAARLETLGYGPLYDYVDGKADWGAAGLPLEGQSGSETRAGAHVRAELVAFEARDGRRLGLEIEPGTYLVARAGAVVATCIDVVDTGRDGYLFAKLDTGMTEVTRPSLYGAQHPIDVLVLTSGSAVRGLLALADDDSRAALLATPVVASGAKTARTATAAGFGHVLTAPAPDAAALAAYTAASLGAPVPPAVGDDPFDPSPATGGA